MNIPSAPRRGGRYYRQVLPALLVVLLVGGYGVYRLNASQAAPLDAEPSLAAAAAEAANAAEAPLTITGDQRFATDPPASIPPSQAFRTSCFLLKPKADCDNQALEAIAQARQREGLKPLAVPVGYETLPVVEQIILVTNAERVDRGLPALIGPDAALNQLALAGAQAKDRPVGPDGYTWGSNWAGNVLSPLAAHYLWMYDDGPNSSNRSCTADNTTGCWGHRHNILSPWSGSIGVAQISVDGYPSMAQLFVKNWNL